MKTQFEILAITRNNVLNVIEDLTNEQLNTIPHGFKNNIIWNVAHIMVTQQLLCYKLAGLPMQLTDEFVDKYRKDSVAKSTTEEEVDYIKKQLIALAPQIGSDYENHLFKIYNEYTTSYNITLDSIEKAISFNNVHEGLHFGYIMAMKKAI